VSQPINQPIPHILRRQDWVPAAAEADLLEQVAREVVHRVPVIGSEPRPQVVVLF
jgi:hypothetical protein